MISIWRACLGAALLFVMSFAQAEALDWQPVHRGVSSEAPECVSWADDRVDCLVRTFGNGMSWVYVEAGGWNLPRNLGGDLAASPSCISRAPLHLELLCSDDPRQSRDHVAEGGKVESLDVAGR
jgi:hypothetical protein